MKRETVLNLLLLAALVVTGACSSNAWDDIPADISAFVIRYFPGQGVGSYAEDDNSDSYAHIVTSGGIRIVFDRNYEWTVIDGNGRRIPQPLVYDELPPGLFQQLESTGNLDNVFKVERTSNVYIVTFSDRYMTYDVVSGTITYFSAPDGKSGVWS